MNYHMFSKQNDPETGNIVIYLLIALALFGALTLMMSRTNEQSEGQSTKDEQRILETNEILAYTAAVQGVLDQMIMSGTRYSNLDFINPSSAGFNTGSAANKIFHPTGGGLNYQKYYIKSACANPASSDPNDCGWFMTRNFNVPWTPTSANDVILYAHKLKKEVCEGLNKKINGNVIIPQLTQTLESIFINGTQTLNATTCAACDGQATLCVQGSDGPNYGYYSIIGGQ